MITDEQFNLANQRAKKKLATSHVATAVRYDDTNARITISLSSGLELSFSPKSVQDLEHAQPADLATIEISPSGLGLYFSKIDTDLYIPSLLHGLLGNEKWMTKNERDGDNARADAKKVASSAGRSLT